MPTLLQHRQPYGSHLAAQATAYQDSEAPTALSPETLQLLDELTAKQAAFEQALQGGSPPGQDVRSSLEDRDAQANPLTILKDLAARRRANTDDVELYYRRLAACRPPMPQANFSHTGYRNLVVALMDNLPMMTSWQAHSILLSLGAIRAHQLPDESVALNLLVSSTAELVQASAESNMQLLEALVLLKHQSLVQGCLAMLLRCRVMQSPSCIADMLELVATSGKAAFLPILLRQADAHLAEAADASEPEHEQVGSTHIQRHG